MDATSLGPVGVWLGQLARLPAEREREAVRRLEAAGYATIWLGEGLGTRDAVAHAANLLAWTDRAAVATGIAGIYSRDAASALAAANTLGEAYPGRFVLGLGVSHAPLVEPRGVTYEPPLRAMRHYLDAMDAAPYGAPSPQSPVPRVLAALGPRMLELARERSDGAHPYLVPVEHTARARGLLGDGRLLAPEQAVVLERRRGEGRAPARDHVRRYLDLPNYRRNLLRLGFSEDELGEPSDRVVEALVGCGDAAALAARVRAHHDAGADHVCVQALGERPLEQLLELAPYLLGG